MDLSRPILEENTITLRSFIESLYNLKVEARLGKRKVDEEGTLYLSFLYFTQNSRGFLEITSDKTYIHSDHLTLFRIEDVKKTGFLVLDGV